MRIAIPVAQGTLCMHFGHCEQFALVDVDPQDKRIVATDHATPPPHEPGVLPRWLAEQGVAVVIAGGMGRRAQALFADAGIQVVTGAPAAAPEQLAQDFVADRLATGENVCDH